jgi:hypothetical protein
MIKFWIPGSGVINYDPYRAGMKKNHKWWAIVKVDRQITSYYRWWVKKEYYIDLYQPSWDAHISIIRGEKPKSHLLNLWKKYDNKRIAFNYEHNVKRDGHFWFVEVDCPFLLQIRKEFQLPATWKLHLTIGRTYY